MTISLNSLYGFSEPNFKVVIRDGLATSLAGSIRRDEAEEIRRRKERRYLNLKNIYIQKIKFYIKKIFLHYFFKKKKNRYRKIKKINK